MLNWVDYSGNGDHAVSSANLAPHKQQLVNVFFCCRPMKVTLGVMGQRSWCSWWQCGQSVLVLCHALAVPVVKLSVPILALFLWSYLPAAGFVRNNVHTCTGKDLAL